MSIEDQPIRRIEIKEYEPPTTPTIEIGGTPFWERAERIEYLSKFLVTEGIARPLDEGPFQGIRHNDFVSVSARRENGAYELQMAVGRLGKWTTCGALREEENGDEQGFRMVIGGIFDGLTLVELLRQDEFIGKREALALKYQFMGQSLGVDIIYCVLIEPKAGLQYNPFFRRPEVLDDLDSAGKIWEASIKLLQDYNEAALEVIDQYKGLGEVLPPLRVINLVEASAGIQELGDLNKLYYVNLLRGLAEVFPEIRESYELPPS